MEAFLVYILKSAIATGIFYLGYVVLFQKSKTFSFNRIYLMVAFISSFLIPLITFVEIKYIEASSSSSNYITYTGFEPANENHSFSGSWRISFIEGVYILFAIGLLLILLTGYIKVFKITRRSKVYNLFNCKVHVAPIDVTPFTFFNKIVIGHGKIASQNLQIIIEHENIHVKEKHSLDILIAELLYILQWFNPFAWLLKEAVKTNLEYITDHKIIQKYNATNYQLAMISETYNQGIVSILPSLSGSQLKNRIAMMKKNPNRKFSLIRQIIVLPMLILLIIVLSEKEVRTEIIHPDVNSYPSTIALQKDDILPGKRTDQKGLDFNEIASLWERKPVSAISDIAINKSLDTKVMDESFAIAGNGFKKPDEAADKSEIRNVRLNDIDTIIGNKKPLVKEEVIGKKYEKIQISSLNEPLYIVDGIITKHINQVPPEDIERIDMLKNETSINLYGSAGKNGVVLISTKSKSYTLPHDTAKTLRPITKEQFSVPEVWPQFPGGKDAYQEYIENNMMYPQSAIEKGIQGTVHVSFKVTREGKIENIRLARGVDPALNDEAIRLVNSMPDWNPGIKKGEPVEMHGVAVPVNFKIKDPVVRVVSYNKSLVIPGPLYIVDGEETGSIKSIDPGDIESIEVLKSPKATAIYGTRGKDGVIIITTKQKTEITEITSELELRRFFARKIKYPIEAHKSGIQGIVSIVIDIDHSNRVVADTEFNGKHIYNLPDVVVIGFSEKDVPVDHSNTETSLLFNEMERIRSMLPKISIPGLKANLLKINVDFRLQSEK